MSDPVFYVFMAPAAMLLIFVFYAAWRERTRHIRFRNTTNPNAVMRAFSLSRQRNGPRYWAAVRLEELARSCSDNDRARIAQFASRNILSQLHMTDNATANEVRRLLDVLAAAHPPWEAETLAAVARSDLESWIRSRALRRLVDMQGAMAMGAVLDGMDDPKLASGAARAAGSLGPVAAGPRTVARLQRLITEAQDYITASTAAEAMIALGRGTDPCLREHLEKFHPWARFAVLLKANDIDADAFVDRLYAAGIIGEDRRSEIGTETLAKFRFDLDREGPLEALPQLLKQARAIVSFDTEDASVPPDYNWLMTELKTLASPRFMIEDAIFMPEKMTLALKFAGRETIIQPGSFGDWFDLKTVLGGLNTALAEAGRQERFATLWSGDQGAHIIIGYDAELKSLKSELNLPVEDDPNGAAAMGQAYERLMVTQFEEELKASGGSLVRSNFSGPRPTTAKDRSQ